MPKSKRMDDIRTVADHWAAQCPACGFDEFRWGSLVNAAFERKDALFMTATTPREVKMRQCLRCGNLQAFARRD